MVSMKRESAARGKGLDRQVVVKNYFEPAVWEATLYKGVTPVRWHHRTM